MACLDRIIFMRFAVIFLLGMKGWRAAVGSNILSSENKNAELIYAQKWGSLPTNEEVNLLVSMRMTMTKEDKSMLATRAS
jgi:hypothetical protein